MPNVEVINEHYTKLASDYDRFLYYSPEFVRTLTSKMIDMLDLQSGDALVDLGGGTGMYTIDILEQVPLRKRATVVDPFPQMLARVPSDLPIDTVTAGGLEFSDRPGTYDKILIKEAVHHIDDRARLFRNLFERLNAGGTLLLVHVPPLLQYPLFEAALERARTWHADPDELEMQMRAAGFQVTRDGLDYAHTLPKDHYFEMVRTGYMSVLTSFSEAEREAGLEEMARRFANQSTLRFTDHFDYILGRKSGTGRAAD